MIRALSPLVVFPAGERRLTGATSPDSLWRFSRRWKRRSSTVVHAFLPFPAGSHAPSLAPVERHHPTAYATSCNLRLAHRRKNLLPCATLCTQTALGPRIYS